MNKMQLFVMWLDGYMEGKLELSQKETYVLKKKLNSLFEHVAEPVNSDNPTLEDLANEHDFNTVSNESEVGGKDKDGVKYRC